MYVHVFVFAEIKFTRFFPIILVDSTLFFEAKFHDFLGGPAPKADYHATWYFEHRGVGGKPGNHGNLRGPGTQRDH